MDRTQLLQGVGAFGLIAGGLAIWYSFQRQMCTMAAGGMNSCSPNIVYWFPGVVIGFVGLLCLVIAYRK